MNILAAATTQQAPPPQQAPYQQMPTQQQLQQQQMMQQQYQQQMTMQQQQQQPKPSLKAKLLGQGLFVFNIAVIIFFVVMTYRFVKAAEKIANKLSGASQNQTPPPQA